MAKVVLDAGHGGFDNGASFGDRREKDDNLKLTLAVGKILKDKGIEVAYTRSTDVYDSPNQKVRIANKEGGDLFVSFHRNSSPTPNTYSGVETLIFSEGGLKEDAANNIANELATVGFDNLGVDIRTNLAVLRGTQTPAVLAEVGFINSDEDNQLFDGRFNDMANAIATGILKTFDLQTASYNDYRYRVQVGLFRNYNNAVNSLSRLIDEGYPAEIVDKGEYYALHVGDFDYLDDAVELEKALRSSRYDTMVIAI